MNKFRKNINGFGAVGIVIVAGVALLIGFAGWYVYGYNNKKVKPVISTVEPATPSKNTTTDKTTQKNLSDSDIDNIKAAVNSGNFAALEGYMAPSVTVLIWSSEGPGPQTPAQAVTALAYLSTATAPWDFNLPAAFKADRIQVWTSYFTNPTTALVGKSANDKLIMINFDNSGKINVIIMAFSSDQ